MPGHSAFDCIISRPLFLFHRLVQYRFFNSLHQKTVYKLGNSQCISLKMPLGSQNTKPLSTLHYYRQTDKATKHSDDNVCEFIRTTNLKTPCPLAGVFPCHMQCVHTHIIRFICIERFAVPLVLYSIYAYILTVKIYKHSYRMRHKVCTYVSFRKHRTMFMVTHALHTFSISKHAI